MPKKFNGIDLNVVKQQLALHRRELAESTYPGYPSRRDRLVAKMSALERQAGRLVLPDGPWAAGTRGEPLPTAREQQQFERQGLELDSKGRPLHPWLRFMIEDPTIGVLTGKRYYWNYGPRHAVDNILLQNGHVLLIQRKDNGKWALPGGFVDNGEDALDAGPRELLEETNIKVPKHVIPKIIYNGLIVDPRMTAHAFPTTTAIAYNLGSDSKLPTPKGGDDARKAKWERIEAALRMGLFGGHPFLLARAVSH